jgi:hypothetical protein
MTLYATLADAKSTMAAGSSSSTTDDAIVLRNLRVVSRRIDRLFQSRRPYFAPYIESREFALNPEYINSREGTFRFNDPLLALTGTSVGTEALTLGTGVKAWPTLTTPIHKLLLVGSYTNWYGYCNDLNEPNRVTIAGTWGYHRDWANAWMAVSTLSAAIVSTTATTFTVADIDGADLYGRIPMISAGALVKIDDEYLEVIATDTATNTATVLRGVNGSTAATHLNAASVSVYQVEEDIRDIVARQAGFKYARRGAYENINIADLGTIQFPADMLAELWGVLRGYMYAG